MDANNPCCQFFDQQINNTDKVKELQKIQNCLSWESISASSFSPKTVENDEEICRQIFSPIHVATDSNELKPTAFDDAANKGLSVDRLNYCNLNEIIKSALDKIAIHNQNTSPERLRTLFAIAKFVTLDVRSILFNGQRGFGIYDTALPNNTGHADICQVAQGKQAGRSVRSQLIDLAKLEIINTDIE